jgi:hypothetical protein
VFLRATTLKAPFEFRYVTINYQNCAVSLGRSHDHVGDEVLMPRGVQDNKLTAFSLEIVLADVYGDATLPFLLLLIEKVSELETRLSILLTQFFNTMHLLLINAPHLEEYVTHEGALS